MTRLLSLTVGILFVFPLLSRAAIPDPLRFYPAEGTDVVVKINNPRMLAESVLNHPRFKEAQALPQVRELLDSADFRNIFRLLAYYEKDLGAPWPELLDKLAGGGITLGFKVVKEGQPKILLVIQGSDENLTSQFLGRVLQVIRDEISRQGNKELLVTQKYKNQECFKIGKELSATQIGAALLIANHDDTLKIGIDQNIANSNATGPTNMASGPAPKQTSSILPSNPAAWLWFNLKSIKDRQEVKDILVTPRNDVFQTLILAGIYDVVRRSDFVAGGLYHDPKGNFKFTLRLPAGQKDMAIDAELHHPRDAKVGGTLPLLEPKGVLFGHSFYLDLNTLYEKRDAIMPAMIAKSFMEGEKQVSRFFVGTSIPEYLARSGVHHRLVATQPEKVAAYTKQPDQKLPAFAFVTTMRHPAFAKSTTSLIKAGALGAGQLTALKSWEEEIAGVPAFGYSFSETGKSFDDPQNLRFNYQPTFASFGSYYIAASNKGLCKKLIEILRQEDQSKGMRPNLQTKFYAEGLAQFADASPNDSLVAMILSQGLKLESAKQQTRDLLNYLRNLGILQFKTDYSETEFHFDVDLKTKK